MDNAKKGKEKKLSKKQRKAIEMLIYQGKKKGEIAEELEIHPSTLSKWLNEDKNPAFVSAYEAELKAADNIRRRNYRAAAQQAQERLIELAESMDEDVALKACKEILDRAGDRPTGKMEIDMPQSGKLAAAISQLGGEGLEE